MDLKNNIVCSEIEEIIDNIPSSSFDLIVTSPPYAGKRKNSYKVISEEKYAEWFFQLSKKLMRTLKSTGSLVVNLKEGVVKGKRQTYALEYLLKMAQDDYWTETFIWNKTNPYPTGNKKRLKDGFEYCWQFTRTNDYKFFPNNCLIPANAEWVMDNQKRKNKGSHNVTNGSGLNMNIRTTSGYARPSNVVTMPTNTINISQACLATQREYFGVDAKKEYVELSNERISSWKDKHLSIKENVFGGED
jgi:site-specific DNA-methyltransferase (adenine-specific)/site-specific DNA-methyltransferase (cytosine-N4-specific)